MGFWLSECHIYFLNTVKEKQSNLSVNKDKKGKVVFCFSTADFMEVFVSNDFNMTWFMRGLVNISFFNTREKESRGFVIILN